ncbi:hypothetical protein [Oligoflexus tunisiensis]|uniref:hypothetical protein n=1 Tax=Oligoflexus tunisiensis TaxID=708132 RepID=UPI00114C8BF2|nr:hypothetical protein [Oligoflexus tunisiensis]
MNFIHPILLFGILFVVSCKTTSKSNTPPPDPNRVVSSGVRTSVMPTTLKEVQKLDLEVIGIAPLPPEANGTWVIHCEDKNTSAGSLALVARSSPLLMKLNEIPRDANYAANVYLKVDGNRYAITIALLKDKKCQQQDDLKSVELMEPAQFILICSWAVGSNECKLKRAIYTALDRSYEAYLNKLEFCGFKGWKEGITYDISDKGCDQTYIEDYADGSSSSESKTLSGNSLGAKTIEGRLTWDDTNGVIKFTSITDGRSMTFKRARAERFFSTLDTIMDRP